MSVMLARPFIINTNYYGFELRNFGHMLTLAPVKLGLTKPVNSTSFETDRAMREKAVYCSLELIHISRQLLDCLLPHNAKFYLGTFLVFDTAAYLCSAIAHDHMYTFPQREKVIEAVVSALGMLEQVRSTKLGATCYTIIRKILLNIPHEVRNIILCVSSSPESSAGGPKSPSDGHRGHHDMTTFSSGFPATDMNGTFSSGDFGSGLPMSAELGPPSSGVSISETANLNDLANMDLGALTQIWDWGYLGFGP